MPKDGPRIGRGITIAAGQLALALSIAGAAQAADLPIAPPTPVISRDAPATAATPFARTVQLGAFSGTFGDTQLDAVRKAIGRGTIDRQGDAGDAEAWLCYDLPAGQRVWLSSGEISGGAVDRVTLWAAGASRSSHCPALPANFAHIAIDGVVTLGMAEADLIRRLGQPGKRSNGWLVFHRQAKTGRFDNNAVLVVKIGAGKVSAVEASRVISD